MIVVQVISKDKGWWMLYERRIIKLISVVTVLTILLIIVVYGS